MTSRAIKLTARNCPFLRAQKALWNRPTYARLSAAVNAGGEDAGRAYLATLVRSGADVDAMARGLTLAHGAGGRVTLTAATPGQAITVRTTIAGARAALEPSGYCPCLCRDCMEVVLTTDPAMCHACEDAGCEGNRECLAAGAYGGEDEDPQPRSSPTPCTEGCPGWAVFDAPHAASIQRCDECWADVPGAPDDAYYAAHPVCLAALEQACAPQPDPPTPIHAACERQGFCLLTADATQPGVIVARLLGALITLAPGLHPKAITTAVSAALVPGALSDAQHPAWDSPAAQHALNVLVELLNAHAPRGFMVLPEGEWHRLGFFQC